MRSPSAPLARTTDIASLITQDFVTLTMVASLMVPVVALAPVRDMAVAATWGLAFTHYFLDSKIWRVSGNRAGACPSPSPAPRPACNRPR